MDSHLSDAGLPAGIFTMVHKHNTNIKHKQLDKKIGKCFHVIRTTSRYKICFFKRVPVYILHIIRYRIKVIFTRNSSIHNWHKKKRNELKMILFRVI